VKNPPARGDADHSHMISDLLKERRLSKLPIYSPYDAGTLAFRFRIGPEPDDMYALTSAADALSACSYSAVGSMFRSWLR
jgi:hypothetical protein